MNFLSEYALFALEVFTLVIATFITLGGLFSIGKKHKEMLEIRSLDKGFESTEKRMRKELGLKTERSKRKKHEKKKKTNAAESPKRFVLDFKGDISASQVEQLRQEITAILLLATSKDEVIIRLESPGGSVNGYGLAAAQLQRIRDQKISLTVCIDQVAASGGYLMACVADQIIAAPFAIIGSIGVVAQIPNFHRLLQKNNIDIELHTAGKYKRTLTLFGENTQEGREKFQEDLEKIHGIFRDYVLSNRSNLNIDQIATGEHWLATEAISLGLVDHIQTSDDYLLKKRANFKSYAISLPTKASWQSKMLRPLQRLFMFNIG